MLLLVFVAMLASCTKENVTTVDGGLSAHLQEIEDCSGCCDVFWDCVEGSDGSSEDLLGCRDDYKACIGSIVVEGGGNWDFIPVWTSYPEEIDFNDNAMEFEFQLYDVENDVFVSNPSSYISGLAFTAYGIDGAYEADGLVDLGSSAALDGDTYTLTVDGDDLDDDFSGMHAIAFRVRINNTSIPVMTGVSVGHYVYDFVPVLINE